MLIGIAASSISNPCGSSAKEFSPASISGMRLWLKADAGTLDASGNPITVDSTAIATWQDQSGLNAHATQSTPAVRPILRTGANGQNGKPAVYFSGSTSLVSGGVSVAGFTVFLAFKSSVAGSLYEQSANIGSNDGFVLYGTSPYTLQVKKGGVFNALNTSLNWSVGASPKLTTHRYNGTSASHTLRLNKSAVSTTVQTAGDPGTTVSNNVIYIASRGASSVFMTGFIYEMIVYNGSLSDSDVIKIENYLSTKWSI